MYVYFYEPYSDFLLKSYKKDDSIKYQIRLVIPWSKFIFTVIRLLDVLQDLSFFSPFDLGNT